MRNCAEGFVCHNSLGPLPSPSILPRALHNDGMFGVISLQEGKLAMPHVFIPTETVKRTGVNALAKTTSTVPRSPSEELIIIASTSLLWVEHLFFRYTVAAIVSQCRYYSSMDQFGVCGDPVF